MQSTIDKTLLNHILIHSWTLQEVIKKAADREKSDLSPTAPKLVEQWRARLDPNGTDALEKRLLWDAVDIDTVSRSMNYCSTTPVDGSWIKHFLNAIKYIERHCETSFSIDHDLAFGEILSLFAASAQAQLDVELGHDDRTVLTLAARDDLRHSLMRSLSDRIKWPLYYHYKNFKPTSEGDDHYATFSRWQISRDGIVTLFKRFPGIARLIGEGIELWINMVTELVARFRSDASILQATFRTPTFPRQLYSVKAGISDPHNHGRTNAICEIAPGLRVVYKCRDTKIDVCYYEIAKLLDRLAQSSEPIIKAPRAIARDAYGWTEYLQSENPKEYETYYRRFGRVAALAATFGANDLHFENVISCDNYPCLVDLETLITPKLRELDGDWLTEAQKKALNIISEGVMNTGILPGWIVGKDGGAKQLGALAEAGIVERSLGWPELLNPGTDALTPARSSAGVVQKFHANSGIPDISESAMSEQFIAGLREMYEILLGAKDSIIESPEFEALQDAGVRILFRPTAFYMRLVKYSYLEGLASSALDRTMLFERIIARHLQGPDDLPTDWPVVRAELESLAIGDIPYFRTSGSSLDITLSSGEVIPGLLEESAWQRALRRISELDQVTAEAEVERARRVLAAFDGTRQRKLDRSSAVRVSESKSDQPSAPNTILSGSRMALSIADKLIERAYIAEDRSMAWTGTEFEPRSNVFRYGVLDPLGLYAGLPGIAVFLAAAARHDSVNHYEEAALMAVECGIRLAQSGRLARDQALPTGAFSGWTSVPYSLGVIGRLLKRPALIAQAEQLLLRLPKSTIRRDDAFDVIAGSAGLILVATSFSSGQLSGALSQMVECAAMRLIETAEHAPHGCCYWVPTYTGAASCGFAHGNSGIAFALMRAWRATGIHEFRKVARAALEYERVERETNGGSWTVFGKRPGPDSSQSYSWCHGAAGISLSRAAIGLIDESLGSSISDCVVASRLLQGVRLTTDGLCHGNFGVASAEITVGNILGEKALASHGMERIFAMLGGAQVKGFTTELFLDEFDSPGLMTGISGIGYELLRSLNVKDVPDILSVS